MEHAFHRFDSIWKYQVGKVHHSIHERRTQHPNNLIECSSCHMFTCKIPFIKPRSKSTVPLPKGGCLYQNPVFIWDIYIYIHVYIHIYKPKAQRFIANTEVSWPCASCHLFDRSQTRGWGHAPINWNRFCWEGLNMKRLPHTKINVKLVDQKFQNVWIVANQQETHRENGARSENDRLKSTDESEGIWDPSPEGKFLRSMCLGLWHVACDVSWLLSETSKRKSRTEQLYRMTFLEIHHIFTSSEADHDQNHQILFHQSTSSLQLPDPPAVCFTTSQIKSHLSVCLCETSHQG